MIPNGCLIYWGYFFYSYDGSALRDTPIAKPFNDHPFISVFEE